MAETISVYVHSDTNPDFNVTVDVRDPIEVLNQYISNNNSDTEKYQLIYKDSHILPVFTFLFYQVQDGDHFYFIPTPKSKDNLKSKVGRQQRTYFTPSLSQIKDTVHYFQLNNDSDTIHKVYDILSSPKSSREIARIKDLHLMKIEGERKLHRKAEFNFKGVSVPRKSFTEPIRTLSQFSYQTNEPSTTELPHPFKLRKCGESVK
ncbi:hypothetical protein TRFO_38589 [Tritrichomonas foetus]|uniref:Ubiquitin-like domain-containing protein n=1 Tax=Tritrichomonas foetus TaxID=1144522 RepID=A0A1J4J7X5_9EUKA|nr:hypothetical protein TRFO_38589 [Tritrichomonas foetus]|eukprot:OHS95302.1 hypothetical protein TRFO_38589 [Tritrichomonas foetus]